jgi:hypothetical protein
MGSSQKKRTQLKRKTSRDARFAITRACKELRAAPHRQNRDAICANVRLGRRGVAPARQIFEMRLFRVFPASALPKRARSICRDAKSLRWRKAR